MPCTGKLRARNLVWRTPRGPERLVRTLVAIAIVGGPLGYLVGSALHPPVQEIGAGGRTIAAKAGANRTVHLIAYVIASFLLPIGAAGLGNLA